MTNSKLEREMEEGEKQLRGIIFDALTKEFNRKPRIPPLETIKDFILGIVNRALTSGEVNNIFITDFLAL